MKYIELKSLKMMEEQQPEGEDKLFKTKRF